MTDSSTSTTVASAVEVDPAAQVARAEDRLAASRAALMAKIDERDRLTRSSGPRPTVASLLDEARRGAGSMVASAFAKSSSPSSDADSMTRRMSAHGAVGSESAVDAPVHVRREPHAAVSELGLAQAARSMLGHLPIPPLVPIVESALDAGEAWWRRQPWYDASDLLIREAESTVGPTIRRHPLLSVSAAAALGAAVVMAKPWRWKALEHSLKPVPQQAKAWFKDQVQRSSVQSLLVAWVLGMVAKAGQAASSSPSRVAAAMAESRSSRDRDPGPASSPGPSTASQAVSPQPANVVN